MPAKEKLGDVGASIREAQIEQMLDGLRRMPMMLTRLRGLAARDEIAAEVIRRYEVETSHEGKA